MVDDLISRKTASEAITRLYHPEEAPLGLTIYGRAIWAAAIDMCRIRVAETSRAVIACKDCAYAQERHGALRCVYSAIDLDPDGFCNHGTPMYMKKPAQMDERVKKAIAEGEWSERE